MGEKILWWDSSELGFKAERSQVFVGLPMYYKG